MNQAPHSFSQQTWPEIADALAAGRDAALLPVGATEQHGPHLGVGMDSVLADRLCSEVSRSTQVYQLPLLSYGCSIGHSQRWPGTVSLSHQTLISVVCDIGEWLYKTGFRRLFIVNCHVGNKAPLHCALDTLRCRHAGLMVALFNTAELTPAIAETFSSDAVDWHANAAETSLMLASAPELVRSEKIAEADDEDRTLPCVFAHPVNHTSTNGVTGKPSLATEAAGTELFNTLRDTLTAKVMRGLKEQPPLTQPYTQ